MSTRHPSHLARAAIGVVVLGTVGSFLASPFANAAPVDSSARQSVLVVLKDQLASTPAAAQSDARRAKATSAQDAVLHRLAGPAVTRLKHFSAANAFSVTLTAAQAAALSADPAVQLVAPDVKVSLPVSPKAAAAAPAAGLRAAPSAAAVPPVPAGVCPSDPSKPLLEPEALSDTRTASDDPSVKTAQQLATGKGVKVAYIADAINPNNPDFIRANGQHVITDYKAFSADGPTPDEGGAEAYGDASSIAAQGLVSHDLSNYVNPAYALPKGCTIRVLGMAPGASIVALKIDFFTSSIVQAIDYAVTTAHVDVLNESFGGNVVPDAAARSAISTFNDMAVAAGTTVTVSSGDAGTTSTIGNPSTDPQVISVAASTNNRSYLQTGYAGARTFSNGTYRNDEISSLSSGGYTQGGGTVDLAAPGEAGWAVCDAASPECVNYNGTGADVQPFGGTSQSAPLTAGAAALVIQAYRSTHGGTSPSPVLVKRLLTSTARDLGLPPFEQGSGLLDARAAVEAALTYPGATTSAPAGVASNIALSTSQIDIAGAPGSSHTSDVTVQNVGTKPLTVAASTRDFTTTGVTGFTAAVDASSAQTFPYPTSGLPWVYKKVTFTVPSGTDRLATAMIWKGQAKPGSTVTPVVRLTLIDPTGAFVTNSRPQGGPVSANYANVDVRRPVGGTWTAVLYTPQGALGYTGDVSVSNTFQQATPVGQVTPPTFTLAPGAKRDVKVTLTVPASGGDTSQAITFGSSDGHSTAVGVVLRSIVPTASGTGTFSGTITGGNARGGAPAESFTYAFDVPGGQQDVGVDIALASDPRYQLEGVLVDPFDEVRAIDTNLRSAGSFGPVTGAGLGLSLNTANVAAGRWRVVLLVVNPVPGAAFTQGFTGRIGYGTSKVTSTVPASPGVTLAKGKATTAKVTVTNTGLAPIDVQVDPRGDEFVDTPLVSPFGSQTGDLPQHSAPTFLVPPNTRSLTASATSSLPALIELTPGTQGIDVVGDLKAGKNGSTVSVAKVAESASRVSSGVWYTDVNEIGAVGPNGAPSGSSRVDLSALTRTFASDVTSSTGDFWKIATNPTADLGAPVRIQPGQSATITVTITPDGTVGSRVHGVLNIITPPSFAFPTFNTTGDLLAQVPYSYTVGAGK